MTITASPTPRLAGVHHLKLPVTDLDRSRRWYTSRLGYEVVQEFHEDGVLRGLLMAHRNGGPMFALRLDPGRARAAAGFDYFSIGVTDKHSIDELARRLSDQGEEHAGVHFATTGWILPMLHDPDGHEVRFYTVEHHTETVTDHVRVVHDAVESEAQRIREAGEDHGSRRSTSSLKDS